MATVTSGGERRRKRCGNKGASDEAGGEGLCLIIVAPAAVSDSGESTLHNDSSTLQPATFFASLRNADGAS
ncbi:MAG: hypothetical protein ABI854_07165, partial [Betaproteobacteria bacterium]